MPQNRPDPTLSKNDRALLKALPEYLRNTLVQYRTSMIEIDPRPLTIAQILEASLRTFWRTEQTPPDAEALRTLRGLGR